MGEEPLIFFHVCAIGSWIHLVKSMMKTLADSGILKTARLHVGLLASKENEILFKEMTSSIPMILKVGREIDTYEHFTLGWLQETIKSCTGNHPVLYFHTKGVSRDLEKERLFHVWRDYLIHWLIVRWEECLENMEREAALVLSVYYRGGPKPHFSGNFWWAMSDYLKTLASSLQVKQALKERFRYIAPELWVLWLAPLSRVISVHQPLKPIRCVGIDEAYKTLPMKTTRVSTL